MSTERARWRVNDQSFIGHALVNPGDEVYYTPLEDANGDTHGVGSNLSPLNDAAQTIVNEQREDHLDKPHNVKKRRAHAAASEEEEQEAAQEKGDGPVPARARKADTRTAKTTEAKTEPKAAKKAAPPADAAKTEDEPKAPKLGKGNTVADDLGVGGEAAAGKGKPDDEEDDDIG